MIKKSFSFQAPGLGEDELELQVPSNFIAGRLGGAHPGLFPISGRAVAGLAAEWISVGGSLCCFWGCPADASRSDAFAVSGCVRAVSLDAPAVRMRSVPRN